MDGAENRDEEQPVRSLEELEGKTIARARMYFGELVLHFTDGTFACWAADFAYDHIRVEVHTLNGHKSLLLTWTDPETHNTRYRSAKTNDTDQAESRRADLERELNDGRFREAKMVFHRGERHSDGRRKRAS